MSLSRTQRYVGFGTLALTGLSAYMHSVAGWNAMATALAPHSVPPDLVASLEAGWLFGGVFLAITALMLAAQLLRPAADGARALRWIGISWITYGAFAVIRYNGNPFFLVFVVMGLGTWFSCSKFGAEGRGAE